MSAWSDSSFGITSQAVVNNKMELVDYLEKLWRDLGDQPILVQEYLTGAEYTVGRTVTDSAIWIITPRWKRICAPPRRTSR